jgi:beta-N-acetylhexosaminidase
VTGVEQAALRVQLPGLAGVTLGADWRRLLDEGLGGICLFGSNPAEGLDRVRELTAAIATTRPGAVVAIDEEGGDVTRLHAGAGSPVLGPAALARIDDVALTRATGRSVGDELASVGVTLDLAPVCDVNSNAANPVIGTRSFGADPQLVARHAAAWTAGLQDAGVAACAKHFPGHGDTSADSHHALPVVDADRQLLSVRELAPFAAQVEAGVAAVMTAHVVVPSLDPELPASLSPAVTSLLREELGFVGAVVTDALDMAGASARHGIPEAAVRALTAGADLVCLGADKEPALVRAVQAAITAAVRAGRLSEARLDEAAERVARLGELGPPTPWGAADVPTGTGFARRSLEVEGELPDLGGALVVRVVGDVNMAMGDVPWGLAPDLTIDPADGAGRLPGDRAVVLQVREAHRQPVVAALLRDVAASGRRAVVVEWGWPGERSVPLARICAHGSSRPGQAAVRELLAEAGWRA